MRFLLLLGLVLSLAAGRAAAAGLVVERAYFEDAGGQMGLEEVRRAPFTRAGKAISRGFTRSTLWLRLTVKPRGEGQAQVLSVLPATLEEVTLFTPAAPGAALPRGIDLRPARLWRHEWVDAAPGLQVSYLRIRSTGAMLVSAEIAAEPDAAKAENQRRILMGVALGCMLPIVTALLTLLVIHRDPLYLSVLLTFVSSTLVYLLVFGHVHEFAPAHPWLSSETAVNLAALGNILGCYLTIYMILCRSHMPRWGRLLTALTSGLLLVLMAAAVWADLQWIRKLGFIVGLTVGPLYAALALWAPIKLSARGWFVRAFVLAISLMAAQVCAQRLGLVEANDWSLELVSWRYMAAPFLFCLIVWLFELERRSRLRLAQHDATSARQSVIDERSRRNLRERFVTTLMHEIKTPLSTIQLAAASLMRGSTEGDARSARLQSINRSVDDLNGVVERYVQVDQFEQGRTSFSQQPFALRDLIGDVRQSLGGESAVVSGDQELMVHSDYQGARVVLLNLLGNASKYSPAGGQVDCEIETVERQGRAGARIRVSNEVGVAGAPDLLRAFSRYYRSEGARRVSGAGLGLWLSQETARAMGTEIVYSICDGRVCFDFWLEKA
jgi:signal transduction histidine kinase